MGNHAFACWHDVPDQPALCQRAQPCNRSSGGQFDLSRVICGDRFVSVLCGIYRRFLPVVFGLKSGCTVNQGTEWLSHRGER